jgi:putative oxidoreductase
MKDDIAKLLLRVSLGGMMLFHGIAKITGGIDFLFRMMERNQLPPWLAYGVYSGEVLAPLLLIIGWYARVGAGLVIVNMLVVFAYAHRADLLTRSSTGGWAVELEAFYLVCALVVALIGPGRYAINRR